MGLGYPCHTQLRRCSLHLNTMANTSSCIHFAISFARKHRELRKKNFAGSHVVTLPVFVIDNPCRDLETDSNINICMYRYVSLSLYLSKWNMHIMYLYKLHIPWELATGGMVTAGSWQWRLKSISMFPTANWRNISRNIKQTKWLNGKTINTVVGKNCVDQSRVGIYWDLNIDQ